MEEATVAVMGNEESEINKEGGGDGMKLVQQLIACAEAVACRDKIYASVSSLELRANALVFGASFQRVAPILRRGLLTSLPWFNHLGRLEHSNQKQQWQLRLIPRRMRPYA
ncbi:hypothetical protein SLA2020_464140 [Shorea laevis]